ncbi:hypothetical protein FRC12_022603 [Ceratobasidium sp. 428]|nr:hypothetical protein FRC12_022603 [Ceratobasidium sp. 428]
MDKVLKLVKYPILVDDKVGNKVDTLIGEVAKFSARAKIAKQATKDTQTKLTAPLENPPAQDQSWSKVTSSNSCTHKGPTPSKAAPAFSPQEATPHKILYAGAVDSLMDKKSSAELVKWLTAALSCTWDQLKNRGLCPKLGLKSAPYIPFAKTTRIPSGGVLFECVNRHHAALLSTVSVAKALEQNLGSFTCKGQRAEILLYTAPTLFNPDDPASIHNLRRKNQIEVGSILHCLWVKPIACRQLDQTRAVLKLLLRSQKPLKLDIPAGMHGCSRH